MTGGIYNLNKEAVLFFRSKGLKFLHDHAILPKVLFYGDLFL